MVAKNSTAPEPLSRDPCRDAGLPIQHDLTGLVSASPLLDNLLMHLPMTDGPWTDTETTEDKAGNRTVTAVNAFSLDTTDKPTNLEGCCLFDDTGEKWTFDESALDALTPINDSWSIALWFKPVSTASNQTIFSAWDSNGATGKRWRMTLTGDTPFFQVRVGGGSTSEQWNAFSVGTSIWYMWAAQFRRGTDIRHKILRAGTDADFDAQAWESTSETGDLDNEGTLTLGDEATGFRPYDSRVCGVTVWSGEQTDENFDTFYNGGSGIVYPFR